MDEQIMMGRAVNGQDGVGSGYDAQVLYPGAGRDLMLALYNVRTKEWVALGTMGRPVDADQAALDRIARELASNPGTFGEELVWDERRPDTYATLAQEWDHLEALYKAQVQP